MDFVFQGSKERAMRHSFQNINKNGDFSSNTNKMSPNLSNKNTRCFLSKPRNYKYTMKNMCVVHTVRIFSAEKITSAQKLITTEVSISIWNRQCERVSDVKNEVI